MVFSIGLSQNQNKSVILLLRRRCTLCACKNWTKTWPDHCSYKRISVLFFYFSPMLSLYISNNFKVTTLWSSLFSSFYSFLNCVSYRFCITLFTTAFLGCFIFKMLSSLVCLMFFFSSFSLICQKVWKLWVSAHIMWHDYFFSFTFFCWSFFFAGVCHVIHFFVYVRPILIGHTILVLLAVPFYLSFLLIYIFYFRIFLWTMMMALAVYFK